MDVLELAILTAAVSIVAGVLLVYGLVASYHASDVGLVVSCVDYVIEHPGETKIVLVKLTRSIFVDATHPNILRTSDGLVYTFPDTVSIVIDTSSGRIPPGLLYVVCQSKISSVDPDSGTVKMEVHVKVYVPA